MYRGSATQRQSSCPDWAHLKRGSVLEEPRYVSTLQFPFISDGGAVGDLYLHLRAIFEQRTGFRGFFWKAARIGERLSPWIGIGCFLMGVSVIFF